MLTSSSIPTLRLNSQNVIFKKHGSLATFDNVTYLSAGSDDFRGYVWKIPNIEEMKERREVVSKDDWIDDTSKTIGE